MTTHEQDTFTQPTEGIETSRERLDPAADRPADPSTSADSGLTEPTTAPQQSLPVEAGDGQTQSNWSDGQGLSPDQPEAEPAQAQAAAPQPAAAVVSAEPSSEQSVHDPAESTSERSLFADDELAGLRARWDNVQAGFVDDPRECVHKADGLVSDVVDQLTAGFSDARTRLEEQWARGEEASTEDLRVALKQYREFFQRLLAV